MTNKVKIWFSKEHTSKSNPEEHYDVYRQASDKSHNEKIAHVPSGETKINITVTPSGSESNDGK